MVRWAIPLLALAAAVALVAFLGLGLGGDHEDDDPLDATDGEAGRDPEDPEALTLTGVEGAKERAAVEAARTAAARAESARPPPPVVPAPREARAPVPFRIAVVGAGGRPARRTTVRVYRDGVLVHEGTTDAEGRLSADLPPGRYEVHTIDADGAVGQPRTVVLDGSDTETIATGLGDGPALRVRFAQGDTVPSVRRVFLAAGVDWETPGAERLEAALASTVPDADGVAVFSSVAHGLYEVIAELTPEVLLRAHHSHASETLHPIAVPAYVTLSGKVTEGWLGAPIPDVTVELHNTIGARRTEVRVVSDREGRFKVAVPRGRYTGVTAGAEGWLGWPPRKPSTAGRQEIAKALANLVRLLQGRDAEIHIPLARFDGPVLVGRVVDEEGRPVSGVPVVVAEDRYGTAGFRVDLVADADGRFELEGLHAGRYRAWVDAPHWKTPGAKPFVIAPDAHEPADIELVVTPAPRIAGHVVKPDGQPAAGARVWLTALTYVQEQGPDDPGLREVFADGQGAWEISGPYVYSSLVVRAAWGDLQSDPLSPTAHGEGALNLRLQLKPAPRLVIRAVEPGSGEPVPWAFMRLRPEGLPSGRVTTEYRCDAQGHLTIRSILGAKWTVAPKSWWHRPGAPVEVDLTEVEGEHTVEIELDPGLAFAGRVLDEAGEAVAAKVRVVGRAVGESINRDRTRDVDAEGFFRLTGYAYGTYALIVTASGYVSQSRQELHGGEELLQVTLKKIP